MSLSHEEPTQPTSERNVIPLRNTLASVVSALDDTPAWKGVLATNRFDTRIVFRRAPPFSEDGRDLVDQPVGDRDINRIRHWFEVHVGALLSKQTVVDAVRIVADRHAFHPVEDYLCALSWDGVPRAHRWLVEYASVRPDDPAHAALVESVARKWLISAVARVMQPGCKVDTMLILEGQQGIGKSRALAALAGPRFFSDAAIDFASKDACQTIHGVWILELAELDAILRRDPSTVKAFLSRGVDRYRSPYGRVPESVPRSVVFAGTVNLGAYLRDPTGHRRYWVVQSRGPLDVEGLREARDQLWAEALHLYRAGATWHLGAEDESRMKTETDARAESDPWEESLVAWTSARDRSREAASFTMDEVLTGALGLRISSHNAVVTTRVSRLLGRLGYERRRRSALPRAYHYVRTDVPPSCRPTAQERSFR
jgi:putative DNA primase/helicase